MKGNRAGYPTTNELSNFSRLLNMSFQSESEFCFFANLICGPKALNNMSAFCHTKLQWKVKERFRNSIRKMKSVCKKIALIEEIFRKICLCTHCQIWEQSDKFPLSLSSLQCPLRVKKLIRENSAKYVNQTGNFYFPPKRKTAISI